MVDTSEINLKEHKVFFVGGEDYLVNNKTVIRGQCMWNALSLPNQIIKILF